MGLGGTAAAAAASQQVQSLHAKPLLSLLLWQPAAAAPHQKPAAMASRMANHTLSARLLKKM